jgi:hypothetical protein
MREKFQEQLQKYKSNRSREGSPIRSMTSTMQQSPVNSRNKTFGKTVFGSQTKDSHQHKGSSPELSPTRIRDGFGLFSK